MVPVALAVCLLSLGQSLPPGFTQEPYAEICAPANIAFAPDGILYAGNNGCNIGPGDPAFVRRVGIGGSPVDDYGNAPIPDPDAVGVDVAGSISGMPGSIIVGGLIGADTGRLSAIHPDESIVDLFGALPGLANPLQLISDGGRMLSIDFGSGAVYEVTGAGVSVLIPGTGEGTRLGLAVGSDGSIFVSGGSGRIEKFDQDGVLIDDAFYEGQTALDGFLAFSPGGAFGEALYARNALGETIAIDDDGNATLFGTGVSGGFAAFGPDGALYVSNSADAMIYRVSGCQADCNDDGNVNILDFVCFQGEWQAQSEFGDCDGNGQYNILDFVCFQGAFQACQ